MAIETTRANVQRYFDSDHGDVSMMAEDVIFTVMATGQEHKGPQGVLGLLNYFYHIAFDAKATPRVTFFDEKHALWEGTFEGKHIGEFAGIPATGREVHVPLCVVYDIENDQITRGNVYIEMPALMQQLGIAS